MTRETNKQTKKIQCTAYFVSYKKTLSPSNPPTSFSARVILFRNPAIVAVASASDAALSSFRADS